MLLGALGAGPRLGVRRRALNASGAGARDLRQALQRSQILAALNGVLPPSGPILNLLRHVDPVGSMNGPRGERGAPRAGDRARPRRADGRARAWSRCWARRAGSGSRARAGSRAGLVVTNAHVVAGEERHHRDDAARAPHTTPTAVHYDPRNDLAILRVPGARPAAAPARPTGVQRNARQPFSAIRRTGRSPSPRRGSASPARVISQDSYGRGPIEREMTPFRGQVRSGNSGGPAVDGAGRVLTTVFAAEQGPGPPGGSGSRLDRPQGPRESPRPGSCVAAVGCGPGDGVVKLTRGWNLRLRKRRRAGRRSPGARLSRLPSRGRADRQALGGRDPGRSRSAPTTSASSRRPSPACRTACFAPVRELEAEGMVSAPSRGNPPGLYALTEKGKALRPAITSSRLGAALELATSGRASPTRPGGPARARCRRRRRARGSRPRTPRAEAATPPRPLRLPPLHTVAIARSRGSSPRRLISCP